MYILWMTFVKVVKPDGVWHCASAQPAHVGSGE